MAMAKSASRKPPRGPSGRRRGVPWRKWLAVDATLLVVFVGVLIAYVWAARPAVKSGVTTSDLLVYLTRSGTAFAVVLGIGNLGLVIITQSRKGNSSGGRVVGVVVGLLFLGLACVLGLLVIAFSMPQY
jgi:hypothetical protein